MGDSDQDWKRWIVGIILPVAAAYDGVSGLILRRASLGSHGTPYAVYGQAAFALSCGSIAAAICLHLYFFWQDRERMAGYREVLLIISLLCFLAAMGRFFYLDFRP